MISGTSRDGVDAVIADFETGKPELLNASCTPYPDALRERLDRFMAAGKPDLSDPECGDLDIKFGHFFARIANDLIQATGLESRDIRGIGSHGQTAWHAPDDEPPMSLQLGRGNVIANVTRVPTVTNFRTADLLAGGQGAPLAPLLHRELFASDDETRAVLNLGGIANLTLLAPGEPVRGWDTGPASCLLDLWIHRHRGRAYDDGGAWGASGTVLPGLLASMLEEPYFHLPAPKSTGLELFNADWLQKQLVQADATSATAVDIQATLAELTANTVTDSLRLAGGASELLVCGGGVHNVDLMRRMAALLGNTPVRSTAERGAHPDWVEANLFAWLARERLANRKVDTTGITGANAPVLLGDIATP
ncbi:anhydro-N-acetylmuramic acid kinase [Marinihelvus fidelis]|uniref:Anhydro-N-acetylmuramic acid kinase n=2 Tax=Marinihelvus fidelis TaxID=2613842 RepID=A0A5N0T927_9GAMM|nr:anhydro-N-acetylmuramic acid kinase [Marinihelvus fidelis]